MKGAGCVVAFVAALLSLGTSYAVTIDTVPVGNPGNPADTRYIDSSHPSGVGAVSQPFRIGTTEVTNLQYVEFLNAVAASDPYGLFDSNMSSRLEGGITRTVVSGNFVYAVKSPALNGVYAYENKPVNFVSAGDGMRFANWLHNGQLSGPASSSTTEDGAYTLNGAISEAALDAVTRNPGARWWLPSENEWYKAAYHKNDGITANYWDYPTATNTDPNNNFPSSDTGNSTNHYDNGYTTGDIVHPMTAVGAYGLSASPYGTLDQGGNVFEITDTLVGGNSRVERGGYYGSVGPTHMHASRWFGIASGTTGAGVGIGFRVATVPEQATVVLALQCIISILGRRRLHGSTR